MPFVISIEPQNISLKLQYSMSNLCKHGHRCIKLDNKYIYFRHNCTVFLNFVDRT